MGCGAFEGMTALLLKRLLRCFGHLLVDYLTVFGCAFASAFRFAAHRSCILSAAALIGPVKTCGVSLRWCRSGSGNGIRQRILWRTAYALGRSAPKPMSCV